MACFSKSDASPLPVSLLMTTTARMTAACCWLFPHPAPTLNPNNNPYHHQSPTTQQPSQKTFRTKRTLAKKANQNRPIPYWIRLRTGNTIRCVKRDCDASRGRSTGLLGLHCIVGIGLMADRPRPFLSFATFFLLTGTTPSGGTGAARSWASKRASLLVFFSGRLFSMAGSCGHQRQSQPTTSDGFLSMSFWGGARRSRVGGGVGGERRVGLEQQRRGGGGCGV